MAYVINDDCISCGACVSGCPVDAISGELPIWKSLKISASSVVLAHLFAL